MKVYELAKIRGVDAKQLAVELGLKSYLSNVPAGLCEEVLPAGVVISEPAPEVVNTAEAVVSIPKLSRDEMWASIAGLGTKSPYWERRAEVGL
jgi:hypothetical protein